MIFQCPGCNQRYNVAANRIPSGGTMRCQSCKQPFAPIPGDGVKVLLGHESSFLGPLVMDLTTRGGMIPYWSKTGAEVVEVVPKVLPSVILLDVALPDAYGFEICRLIRQIDGFASAKIIYLASVYDRTRYKRRPTALYGADDYIEKHHIKDDLVAKIRLLLPRGEAAAVPRPTTAPVTIAAEASQFRSDEIAPTKQAGKSDLLTKAHRFARIIVSDIGLYNQEAIDRGLVDGKVREYLAKDLEEGKKLFHSRFPTEALGGEDPLEQAMEDYLGHRRAQGEGR
jgi:predicted Zn finger-like uncharacterized protein